MFELFIITLITLVIFLFIENKNQAKKLEEKNYEVKNSSRENNLVADSVPKPPTHYEDVYGYKDANSYNVADNQFAPKNIHAPELETVSKENKSAGFFSWLMDGFLMKLGSLFILISVGWFVSYAFTEKWIGEVGVITLGILLGIGIMIFGVFRFTKSKRQGEVLVILGSLTVLIVTTTAVQQYEMFSDGFSAFLLMFLAIAFSAFVSVKHDSKNLAIVNIVSAGLLPYLVQVNGITFFKFQLFIMPYLLVMLSGVLWVVWITRWRILIPLGLIITYISSSILITWGPAGTAGFSALTAVIAHIFILIFFITNITGIVRQAYEEVKENFVPPSSVAIGTVLLLLLWTEALVSEEMIGFVLFVWSLVFAFGSFVITRLTNNKSAFYLYGSLGLGLLGVATVYQFDGVTLTAVLTFEILALVLAAAKVTRRAKTPLLLCLLYVVPNFMALGESVKWQEKIREGQVFQNLFNEHAFAVTMFVFALVASVLFIKKYRSEDDSKAVKFFFKMFVFFTAVISLIWFRTLFFPSIFSGEMAVLVSIFLLVVAGLVFQNIKKEEKGYRITGYILLGIGIFELFANAPALSVGFKVAIFALIGTLLIVNDLLNNKKRG